MVADLDFVLHTMSTSGDRQPPLGRHVHALAQLRAQRRNVAKKRNDCGSSVRFLSLHCLPEAFSDSLTPEDAVHSSPDPIGIPGFQSDPDPGWKLDKEQQNRREQELVQRNANLENEVLTLKAELAREREHKKKMAEEMEALKAERKTASAEHLEAQKQCAEEHHREQESVRNELKAQKRDYSDLEQQLKQTERQNKCLDAKYVNVRKKLDVIRRRRASSLESYSYPTKTQESERFRGKGWGRLRAAYSLEYLFHRSERSGNADWFSILFRGFRVHV